MKIPKAGQWTFESEEIAQNFDNHVREQLPWYEMVTDAVRHICCHYLPENGVLYDIGASTGNITSTLSDIIEDRSIRAISVEPSKQMCELFSGKGELINKSIQDVDLERFDVCVMFLSMMFIPVNYRMMLISDLLKNCNKGGCIVIVDKCPAGSGYLSTVLYRLTLEGKIRSGAKPEDIIKKELSIGGAQRPFDGSTVSGAVEFFRHGDFAGWVVENNF